MEGKCFSYSPLPLVNENLPHNWRGMPEKSFWRRRKKNKAWEWHEHDEWVILRNAGPKIFFFFIGSHKDCHTSHVVGESVCLVPLSTFTQSTAAMHFTVRRIRWLCGHQMFTVCLSKNAHAGRWHTGRQLRKQNESKGGRGDESRKGEEGEKVSV